MTSLEGAACAIALTCLNALPQLPALAPPQSLPSQIPSLHLWPSSSSLACRCKPKPLFPSPALSFLFLRHSFRRCRCSHITDCLPSAYARLSSPSFRKSSFSFSHSFNESDVTLLRSTSSWYSRASIRPRSAICFPASLKSHSLITFSSASPTFIPRFFASFSHAKYARGLNVTVRSNGAGASNPVPRNSFQLTHFRNSSAPFSRLAFGMFAITFCARRKS